MPRETVSDTSRAFEAGELSREEFWREMQQHHRRLSSYTSLVDRGRLLRIDITAEELNVVLANGLKFQWDPEDIRTAPNILLNHGSYEADELVVMRQLTRDCRTVFDIGANIGWYTMHLAKWIEPNRGSKVYSFEPMSGTFNGLIRNVSLNAYDDRVLCSRTAFGDREEERCVFYLPDSTGSVAASRRPLFPDENNATFECPMTTLDKFAADRGLISLDFIKCDVEGSELDVVRGGMKTIAALKPVILLEMLRKWAATFDYHPDHIIQLLAQQGYRCGSYQDGRFVELQNVDESCVATNFIFLHHEKHRHLWQLGTQ